MTNEILPLEVLTFGGAIHAPGFICGIPKGTTFAQAIDAIPEVIAQAETFSGIFILAMRDAEETDSHVNVEIEVYQ